MTGVTVPLEQMRSLEPPVLRRVPAVAVGLTAGLSFFNAPLVTLGSVSIRLLDLALLVAVMSWLMAGRRSGPPTAEVRETRTSITSREVVAASAVAFSLVVVLSATWVALSGGGRLSSVVSAGRVIESVFLGAVSWRVVRSEQDFVRTTRAVVGAAGGFLLINALGITLFPEVAAAAGVTLGPYGKAFIGPAAVIAVLAAFLLRDVQVWLRVALVALAAIGLISIASITAYLVFIVVVSAVTGLRAAATGSALKIVRAVVTAFVITASLSYLALTEIRPDAFPSWEVATQLLPGFQDGGSQDQRVLQPEGPVAGATVLHRAILAYTAIQVFVDRPVTGVGWTRGADPEVVGDPAIVESAKEAFPGAWATLFTDTVPSGAHNAVLQALAELGVVGALPLVALMLASAILAARGTNRLPASSERNHRLFVFGCVLLCVGFLMTNGLFPGQPETAVWAWATGTAASRARTGSPRRTGLKGSMG